MSLLPKPPITALLLCSLPLFSASAATITIGVENIDYLPCYGLRDNNYIGFARELLGSSRNAVGGG